MVDVSTPREIRAASRRRRKTTIVVFAVLLFACILAAGVWGISFMAHGLVSVRR
jgi:hypothetical protein